AIMVVMDFIDISRRNAFARHFRTEDIDTAPFPPRLFEQAYGRFPTRISASPRAIPLRPRPVRCYTGRLDRAAPGKVAEWSNAPDSKSGIRVSRIEGSNPSLSAILLRTSQDALRSFSEEGASPAPGLPCPPDRA